jgi:cell division protein FtsN
MWFAFGLGVGLAVALGVHLHHLGKERTAGAPLAQRAAKPASVKEEEAGAAARSEEGSGFDFYTMLPDLEVVVPQESSPAGRGPAAGATVTAPGRYWLQAGSFKRYEDADRRKAELALLGFSSGIQAVSLDGQTWHRVRIGPLESAGDAEAARRRLAENGIGALAVREKN